MVVRLCCELCVYVECRLVVVVQPSWCSARRYLPSAEMRCPGDVAPLPCRCSEPTQGLSTPASLPSTYARIPKQTLWPELSCNPGCHRGSSTLSCQCKGAAPSRRRTCPPPPPPTTSVQMASVGGSHLNHCPHTCRLFLKEAPSLLNPPSRPEASQAQDRSDPSRHPSPSAADRPQIPPHPR